MVSLLNDLQSHIKGLSTDEKPTTGVCNGSDFLEMDTGSTYYWDAEGGEWVKPGS